MNIEELREYCMSIKDCNETISFLKHNTLVFKVLGKMFAYISLEPKDGVFRVNLRCDLEQAIELREKYTGITKSDSKRLQWNQVTLDSDVPDSLIKELIWASVSETIKKLPQKTKEEYYDILHIRDCNSTNNTLTEINKKKLQKEGFILWADFQSAGKGQRGNKWESEKGENLLFSMILYPKINANTQFIISQIASLAVADCLLKYTNNITIKWPNDIYWGEEKICGMLIENILKGNNISQSIVGIGININQTMFLSDAPNPVSLRQITGVAYNLFNILNEVRININNYYKLLKTENADSIRQRYKDLLFRNEGYHQYADKNGCFEARIKDVEPSGLLVLETRGGLEYKYAFNKVKYVSPSLF